MNPLRCKYDHAERIKIQKIRKFALKIDLLRLIYKIRIEQTKNWIQKINRIYAE